MLEQLISSLKSEVGDQIMSQTNLPEGHFDQIFSIINDVTKKEVAGHIFRGKLSEVENSGILGTAKNLLGGFLNKE